MYILNYECFDRIVIVWPGVIKTVYSIVDEIIDLQKQNDLFSLLSSNDSETPLFFSWCEMRKYKLIQSYGFSYHRHRMGFFCKIELNNLMN